MTNKDKEDITNLRLNNSGEENKGHSENSMDMKYALKYLTISDQAMV